LYGQKRKIENSESDPNADFFDKGEIRAKKILFSKNLK
jgi:hypothetical protein